LIEKRNRSLKEEFMTLITPEVELVGLPSEVTSETRPQWIKPEFEFVDLCCEVTLYLHQ
jgi:hypothetical protein